MSVTCPSCTHEIQLETSCAGRFRTRCPGCAVPLTVIIPEHPDERWVVRVGSATVQNGNRIRHAAAVVPPVTEHDSHCPLLESPKTEELSSHSCDTPISEGHLNRSSFGSCPGSSSSSSVTHTKPPTHVPGYVLDRLLGHGGMGSVYLGRQLSLDRPVALKVMSRKWASDPVFVARFTREAYAAARLNHPNVVQIYDIGEHDGHRYFSMEFVPGRTLAEMLRYDGKVEPETAVGYILQAARGLKHAHDRGMIHRDVKPDNLLLNDQGIIKVADLGLVKTPGSALVDQEEIESTRNGNSGLQSLPPNMTGVHMALGTPAYMAPEQCRDAACVDHRADIYSLGCTLYVLLTGRQPFEGNTAVEVMTKHAYEPLTPPDQIVARVPKELSAIIQKMMAKYPEDRYANMGEVVRTLEQWLGILSTETFSPREEHIEHLEAAVQAFNAAPTAILRERLMTGFLSGCLLFAVLLMFFGKLGFAFGLAGMVIQASLAYFIMNGLTRRTYFFQRVRQFVLGASTGDWLVGLAGLGLFTVLLGMLDLLTIWTGFGLIGFALAGAVRIALDRAVEEERRPTLQLCESLLRRMRAGGVDEESLRQFVTKYAGKNWEEFYEAMFGYEAKLSARNYLQRSGNERAREKFASWREPLIAFIDRVEKERKASRERALLVAVECDRLLAAGVDEPVARDQAAQAASALIRQADVVRDGGQYRQPANATSDGRFTTFGVGSGVVTGIGRVLTKPESASRPTQVHDSDAVTRGLGFLVGPTVRLIAALILLAAYAAWLVQSLYFGTWLPLQIEGIDPALTSWCDTANVGCAGILLIASLWYRGIRMGGLLMVAASVVAVGHQYGIRTVEPIHAVHVSLFLGAAVALIGFRVGRRNS